MKPERQSKLLLGATRSKAKMNEYGVEEEHHINLTRDPANLFTLSIGLLGEISAQLNQDSPNEQYLKELREDLHFSAYFFDAYLQTKLQSDMDDYVLLLGSASYYLCDLPGSSIVLVNRINKNELNLECSNLEKLLIWLLVGDFTIDLKVVEGSYTKEIEDISMLLIKYYTEGHEQDIQKEISKLRFKAYSDGTPRELLFSDVISAVVKKRIANSSRKCLPVYSGIDIEDWEPILRNKFFVSEFWPAQHLLGKQGVFKGQSAIVQLPTSAGKTKATEIIIRSAFLSQRTTVAVIVAPFKALCHEISESLNKSFNGESIYVNELSDILQIDFEVFSILSDDQILVVTPEKLIYILRHFPEFAKKIGLLIYDEGHQFDSGNRGINYELLLTSLKGMVAGSIQKVLISAVISNAEIVGDWLNGEENKVISGINLSPTFRTVAFTSWLDSLGRLEFINIENPDERDFYVPRILQQQQLNLKGQERNERIFPERNDGSTVSLFLGLKLVSNGSIAIFAGKKNIVSSLCEKVVDAYERGLALKKPYDYSDEGEMKSLYYLYKSHLGSDEAITKSVELGILSHHGNIPTGIRLAVEHALKENLAKFVICTSTLAQGVNLPIRYLIVLSLYHGTEKIKVRDFHNLIGRVGRSGMHTEGSILFADPSIYDKRNIRRDKWRWNQVKEILDSNNSEPIGSSILRIFDPLFSDNKRKKYTFDNMKFFKAYIEEPDRIFDGLESIATQYATEGYTLDGLTRQIMFKIEAISSIESYLMANWEHVKQGNVEINITTLAEGTFAYTLASNQVKSQIVELFRLLAQNISSKIPQDSKKKLFGKMLYGVKTSLDIENWCNLKLEEIKNCDSMEKLLYLLWPLLSNKIDNSTFNKCDKPDVLMEIALKWINGRPYVDLLKVLIENDVRIKTKKQRRKFKIEQVVEICESAFAYECMLLVGAVAEVTKSILGEENEVTFKLNQLQKQIKYGLPNKLTIMLYELGFADRVISLDLSLSLEKYIKPRSKLVLKRLIRREREEITDKLKKYPSYFTHVLYNILN
ncbi:DEAD/DEAH box helicase [Neobacillus niacini]|uniref:DEAD/DEAH box helicase n=1 Tax=Neobacillus niacini TaxID=86668 RepID=UPI001C8F04CA|nr:DEAD/DEAH box helicase [Neobacillus niacini]MBY0148723.1 DEAD/DEAH box helicase [Neobacillus niacini]